MEPRSEKINAYEMQMDNLTGTILFFFFNFLKKDLFS